jgi:CheY-like chemotaxis protein
MKNKLNCVMLIDDDEATNFLHQIVVKETGCTHHVKTACGAKEALNYLNHSSQHESTDCPVPDLIFLDLNMPGMNGWEFLAMYGGLDTGQKKKPKIVMLTTSLDPDDVVRANTYPEVAAFEGKPCTNEMIDKILVKYFPDNI